MKPSFFNSISLWILPGLIAGVVFLGIAMIAGALATTAWAMPAAIAQVIGITSPTGYGFALVPVIVGIVIHLALSIGLGAILMAFARWRRLYGWKLVVAAFILITIETPIVLWGILHSLLPATMFNFYLGAVPLWGSLLGHYMYALILGLLLALNPSITAWKPQQPTAQLETRG